MRIRSAVLLMAGALGLLGVLYAQRPFRQYQATEYEDFPLPADWKQKTEWTRARLHYPSVYGQFRGQLDLNWTIDYPRSDRHLLEGVREGVKTWKVAPQIVVGEQERRAAFRIASAALAKSGTVTLELALAGVPMVAAYRAGAIEAWFVLRAITVQSVILANLVVGENVVPEFIQDACTADNLAGALGEVLSDSPMRQRQLAAFARMDGIMSTGNQPPSVRAADIVLATLRKSRRAG